MAPKQTSVTMLSDVFSDDLVSKVQDCCKKKYGKDLEDAEAQDVCLKIATFVFLKERRRRRDISTI